jgi:MFS superfamily sulfate permease-like transporter
MDNTFNNFWNDVNTYAQSGFAHINALQGLLIAIVAAFMMYRWGSVFFVAIGATIVHVIVDVMLPVLANGAQFKLPPMVDGEYWRYLLTLYVGYLIVISIFYVVKRMLMSGERELA